MEKLPEMTIIVRIRITPAKHKMISTIGKWLYKNGQWANVTSPGSNGLINVTKQLYRNSSKDPLTDLFINTMLVSPHPHFMN